MLKKFTVCGYRNFAVETTLDLSDARDYRFNADAVESGIVKCALLYGRNAVGKSNFGRALLDIACNVHGYQPTATERTAYLNADAPTESATFEYAFDFGGSEVVYRYVKRHACELVRESLSVDGAAVFDYDFEARRWNELNRDVTPVASLNLTGVDKSLPVLRYICNNAPTEQLGPIYSVYAFAGSMSIIDEHRSFSSHARRVADYVVRSGRVGDLERFLRRFGIEERLVVQKTPSGEDVLYFEKGRLIPFYEYCSSGTRALLMVFDMFESGRAAPFVFIDEFDAFYHHELAEEMVGYLKEKRGAQVIAATHNTDLFSNRVLRPDCLFILSKDGLVSAANATGRELREGHNLEKLYKAGEFDAR